MSMALWQAHLTFALLGALLLPLAGRPRRLQGGALAVSAAIGFAPVEGLPLAAYLRALVDDLSITTLIALGWATLVRLRLCAPLASPQRWQLLVAFALLALILYPATLGLTYTDPYRLGYNPRPLLVAIGLLALLMLHRRNRPGAVALTVATLAFALDLKPSDNYWDYLLDPFVALYCWGALLVAGARRWWPRRAVS